MMAKLTLLYQSATELDMKIHPDKSRFLTVNAIDNTPFHIGDVVISHTESYCYLGSLIFVSHMTKQVNEHVKIKQAHVLKFTSFVHKNSQPHTK